jgi:hypothetical protein
VGGPISPKPIAPTKEIGIATAELTTTAWRKSTPRNTR